MDEKIRRIYLSKANRVVWCRLQFFLCCVIPNFLKAVAGEFGFSHGFGIFMSFFFCTVTALGQRTLVPGPPQGYNDNIQDLQG